MTDKAKIENDDAALQDAALSEETPWVADLGALLGPEQEPDLSDDAVSGVLANYYAVDSAARRGATGSETRRFPNKAELQSLSNGDLYLELVPILEVPQDPLELDKRAIYLAALMRLSSYERNEHGGVDLPEVVKMKLFGEESQPVAPYGRPDTGVTTTSNKLPIGKAIYFPLTKLYQRNSTEPVTQQERHIAAIKISYNALRKPGPIKILATEVQNLLDGGSTISDIHMYIEGVLNYYWGASVDQELFSKSYGSFPPTLNPLLAGMREEQNAQSYDVYELGSIEDAVTAASGCISLPEALAHVVLHENSSEELNHSGEPRKLAITTRTEQAMAQIWWVRARQLGA